MKIKVVFKLLIILGLGLAVVITGMYKLLEDWQDEELEM